MRVNHIMLKSVQLIRRDDEYCKRWEPGVWQPVQKNMIGLLPEELPGSIFRRYVHKKASNALHEVDTYPSKLQLPKVRK